MTCIELFLLSSKRFKRSAQIIKLEGLLKLKLVHVALLQIHCSMRVFELHATELQIIKNRKT